MSTKDISRSAVEGGRQRRNKYDRNESHRRERARARVWLDAVRFDVDVAVEAAPRPRNKVGRGFTDKLNPCYRWLAAHVGQPWAEVRSKLQRTFDTRKLSAWHIVNQHMLTEIAGAGTPFDGSSRQQRFEIDAEGVLRDHGRERPVDPWAWMPGWLNGRKVIEGRRGVLFWAVPGAYDWITCKRRRYCAVAAASHRTVDRTPATLVYQYTHDPKYRTFVNSPHWRVIMTEHYVLTQWRQTAALTAAEATRWATIPAWRQELWRAGVLWP